MKRTPLPIDAVLHDLAAALRSHGRAVLQAPPGAGKTTRVPLFLLEEGLAAGRILMLEPRRLAARAAAERMAAELPDGAPVVIPRVHWEWTTERLSGTWPGLPKRSRHLFTGSSFGIVCPLYDKLHAYFILLSDRR